MIGDCAAYFDVDIVKTKADQLRLNTDSCLDHLRHRFGVDIKVESFNKFKCSGQWIQIDQLQKFLLDWPFDPVLTADHSSKDNVRDITTDLHKSLVIKSVSASDVGKDSPPQSIMKKTSRATSIPQRPSSSFTTLRSRPIPSFHSSTASSVFSSYLNPFHGQEMNADTFQHITSGARIHVLLYDITKLRVDMIINSAPGDLELRRGVAKAIAKAAGNELEKECTRHVRKYGNLKTTESFISNPGDLPCNGVMHAVGPVTLQHDLQRGIWELEKTIMNCLNTASYNTVRSLALPPMGAGR